MTLATFLVLFAVMMARLRAGADPALRASTPTALVAGVGEGAVTTRTSGGRTSTSIAAPAAASEAGVSSASAIVTRTSGVPGTPEGRDE